MAVSSIPVVPPRRTAAEEVYVALKQEIITLQLEPGASLTEQELAERFGTSRVPVREACRRLQQEGLLNAIPYKGYFVRQISLKEISDCFDLRVLLETYAVECAVERASDQSLAELAALARTEYTYHDWTSYVEFLERNLEFHLQLAALSENACLINNLHDLIGTMQRFFFLGLDLGDFAEEMRSEHEELLKCLTARDKECARQCMRNQIERSRERIMHAVVRGRFELPVK